MSTEVDVMMALRESRLVTDWFPPESSGAGDLIEELMNKLREEWGLPARPYFSQEWEWNRG